MADEPKDKQPGLLKKTFDVIRDSELKVWKKVGGKVIGNEAVESGILANAAFRHGDFKEGLALTLKADKQAAGQIAGKVGAAVLKANRTVAGKEAIDLGAQSRDAFLHGRLAEAAMLTWEADKKAAAHVADAVKGRVEAIGKMTPGEVFDRVVPATTGLYGAAWNHIINGGTNVNDHGGAPATPAVKPGTAQKSEPTR